MNRNVNQKLQYILINVIKYLINLFINLHYIIVNRVYK